MPGDLGFDAESKQVNQTLDPGPCGDHHAAFRLNRITIIDHHARHIIARCQVCNINFDGIDRFARNDMIRLFDFFASGVV